MITDKDIARINELYHKAKEVGLTEEEKKEQAELRGAYVAAIRKNLRSNLEKIDLVNPDGSIEHVQKKKTKKQMH